MRTSKKELAAKLEESFLAYVEAGEDESAAAILPNVLNDVAIADLNDALFTREMLGCSMAVLIKARKAVELGKVLESYRRYSPRCRVILWGAMAQGVLHADFRTPQMSPDPRNPAYLDELGLALLSPVRGIGDSEREGIAQAVREKLRHEEIVKHDHRAVSNVLWILRRYRATFPYYRWETCVAKVLIHTVTAHGNGDEIELLVNPLEVPQTT